MGCGKKLKIVQSKKLQKQLEFPKKFAQKMKTKTCQQINQI